MQTNKQTYLLFGLAALLIVVILGIAIISFLIKPPSTPSVSTTEPTPTPFQRAAPPVKYDPQAVKKSVQELENKQPLSQADTLVKNKLIALIPSGSEIVYETADFRIHYSPAFELFDTEILTTNIDGAKAETISWFRSQGMSQQGICSAPVQFYLNFTVANRLRNSNITFNPLPPGC